MASAVNSIKRGKQIMKMSTKEVADILGRPHHDIFKKVSCLLVKHPEHQKDGEFVLTYFENSHKQHNRYPCYEMTEEGCNTLYDWLKGYKYYRTVEPKMNELKIGIRNRFHPIELPKWVDFGDVSLKDRPRCEYQNICNLYERFISGTENDRDLQELSEACDAFYEVVKKHFPETRDNNEVVKAMYDVLGEAEMQGFIYGFMMCSLLTPGKESVA